MVGVGGGGGVVSLVLGGGGGRSVCMSVGGSSRDAGGEYVGDRERASTGFGEYTGDAGAGFCASSSLDSCLTSVSEVRVVAVCWFVVLVEGGGASSTSTKWVARGFSERGLFAAGVLGKIVMVIGWSFDSTFGKDEVK